MLIEAAGLDRTDGAAQRVQFVADAVANGTGQKVRDQTGCSGKADGDDHHPLGKRILSAGDFLGASDHRIADLFDAVVDFIADGREIIQSGLIGAAVGESILHGRDILLSVGANDVDLAKFLGVNVFTRILDRCPEVGGVALPAFLSFRRAVNGVAEHVALERGEVLFQQRGIKRLLRGLLLETHHVEGQHRTCDGSDNHTQGNNDRGHGLQTKPTRNRLTAQPTDTLCGLERHRFYLPDATWDRSSEGFLRRVTLGPLSEERASPI